MKSAAKATCPVCGSKVRVTVPLPGNGYRRVCYAHKVTDPETGVVWRCYGTRLTCAEDNRK